MISGEDFERTIQNFDGNFSLHLMDLLEKLSHYSTIDCEHQMLNIIARLDHNGYYTAQLEKKAAEGETYSSFVIRLLVLEWEVNKSAREKDECVSSPRAQRPQERLEM